MRLLLDQNLPRNLPALLAANLPALADDLDAGAIVVLSNTSVRIRKLPIL